MWIGGKTLLIDPVFSDNAAPFSFSNRAFAGSNIYTAENMPPIDYLLISHDHWDHLDYPSVTALADKIGAVICGLGVGAHFEHWGYAKKKIREADWYTTLRLDDNFTLHILPARHFSGRTLTRNKTLWVSFALETSSRRIFFSGDSGYSPHFQEIGQRFSGFDLAILENGQYNKRWAHIHMQPEETAQAADDLQAKTVLPAHNGKFSISSHAWDEPLKRLFALSTGKSWRLLTPKIGEPMYLDDAQQTFSRWWEKEIFTAPRTAP
jgi:L-ascorbate metabolism protein UlaG (beta-lactamase superfamily)